MFPKSPPGMETLEVFTAVQRANFKDDKGAVVVKCLELGKELLYLAMLLAEEHLKIERGNLSRYPTLRKITSRSNQCPLTIFVLGKAALPTDCTGYAYSRWFPQQTNKSKFQQAKLDLNLRNKFTRLTSECPWGEIYKSET